MIQGDINRVQSSIVAHGKTQIPDSTRAIALHQNVLGLEVTMSNCRLACSNETI